MFFDSVSIRFSYVPSHFTKLTKLKLFCLHCGNVSGIVSCLGSSHCGRSKPTLKLHLCFKFNRCLHMMINEVVQFILASYVPPMG